MTETTMNNLIDKQMEILQALKEGKEIEVAVRVGDNRDPVWETYKGFADYWDWSLFEYRVKREPRTLTLWRLANSNMEWRVAKEGDIHPAHETMVVREVLDD